MADANSSPIVGIDLGTTNSVVAAMLNGRLQVLAEDGEPLLPSVVGLDPSGTLIVGQAARNAQVAFPERTITSVKRRMGETVTLPLGEQQFSPQEVSAMILQRLKARAERALGTSVSRAVITVPAFFDDQQRQATREAGELAGLKVERIINEPTAATIVYRAGSDDAEHLVVYDLGGGTFDVSVVRMERGVVEVLSSKGDTHLGGDDFDQLLMDHVADEFQDEHGIDLREQASTRWRLLQACEQAKRRLSDEYAVRFQEEFIAEVDGRPQNLDLEVTRDAYEGLIKALVDRTIDCVDEALRDANLSLQQIDQLILVGGSTRTPLVQERLRQEFHREPQRSVDPDLAVALGAATQAAMLDGIQVGPVLVDVTPHTLGIEVLDGFSMMGKQMAYSPIIHRNSPLPAKYEEAYGTVCDGQKKAEIHVLQGEHREVARNRSVGKFYVDLDESQAAGNKVIVRFELTLDGTLKVTAIEHVTGTTEVLQVENALSEFQEKRRSQAKIRLADMFAASAETGHVPAGGTDEAAEDIAVGEGVSAGGQATAYPEAAALLEQARSIRQGVTGQDAEDIQDLTTQLQEAMEQGKTDLVTELTRDLEDLLFYVQG